MEPYENIEYYTAFQTSFSYRSELMIGIRWRKLLCDICDNENFVRQWLFFFCEFRKFLRQMPQFEINSEVVIFLDYQQALFRRLVRRVRKL